MTGESMSKPYNQDYDDLEYIAQWVGELYSELRRHDGDKEFVTDMLASARENFIENFSENQMADAFIYVMGLVCRTI